MKRFFLFVFLISCVYAQPMDEYSKVIKDYFDLLKSKEYKKAYDLLSPVNISLSMAIDSSDHRRPKDLPRCGYSARMNYNYWLKMVQNKNIDSLQLVKIEEVKFDYSDNSWIKQMILGFKCYIAGFKEKGNEDSESFLEKLGGYVWVVKGSDGKVRILSAGGTGP